MIFGATTTILALATTLLQTVTAQDNTSGPSAACNNSPELCARQYNNVTHLGAHNSPFLRNADTGFSTSGNQFYSTSDQLSAGVRLVTGQVHTRDDGTELRVCHSSCSLLDAGSLSDWLEEIRIWLDSNPNDVVTILLVNGAGAGAVDFASAYTASGLDRYSYVPSTAGATDVWPTLQSLISSGTRAMNFVATLDDNSAAPYLMNEFDYVVENSYDNNVPTDYSCEVDRPSHLAFQTATAISQGYMTLMNHFLYSQQLWSIQTPNETYATTTNAPAGGVGNLGTAASACLLQYGKAPTFILVDFFNMGPTIATVDSLNQVSSTTGRLSLPTTALSMNAATSAAFPRLWSVMLGLSTALLARILL